jgi:hypothetical protein
VSADGTQFSISFAVGDWIISNGTAWEKVDLTDAVSSVFGRTGAVVGVSTDYSAVGLTNTAIGAANPSSGAFTSLSSSSTTTLNGTTVPASKTLVVTTDKLSALAATTSAELAGVISDETGSGALVFATSPTLVSPALGAATATSISASGTVTGSNLSGTNTGDQTITLTGGVTGSGTGSFAATVVTNANLTGVITSSGNATSIASQTGTGTKFVVDTSPTLVTPILGTPQSGTLTSCTGLPISTGVSGLGTGIATALAVNTGSAGAPVLFNGALGTPTSGTVTNLTGTASININGTVGATTPSTGAFTTLSATGQFNLPKQNLSALQTGTANTGTIQFYQSSGDSFKRFLDITAGDDGGGGVASNIRFLTASGNGTITERVRIDGSGNVGIGNTSPTALLALSTGSGAGSDATSTGTLQIRQASTGLANGGGLEFHASTFGSGYGFKWSAIDSSGVHLVLGSRENSATWTERLRVNSTGLAVTGALSATGEIASFGSSGGVNNRLKASYNSGSGVAVFGPDSNGGTTSLNIGVSNAGTYNTVLGISTTGLAVTGVITGTSRFVSNGGAGGGNGIFDAAFNGNTAQGLDVKETADASGATFVLFRKNSGSTPIGSITRVTTTDVVAFNTTSDRRIKENIGALSDSGRLIDSLTPRTFDRKDGSDTDRKGWLGFVAQEVYAADPVFARIGFVIKGDDNPTEVSKVWGVGGSPLDALLVAELKSVRARLAALESK